MKTNSTARDSGWDVSFWFAVSSPLLGVLLGFLFMHFSQAFEDRHFTKRELLFDMRPRRFFQNGNENAQGVVAQRRAPGDPRNRFGLETATVQQWWFLLANVR